MFGSCFPVRFSQIFHQHLHTLTKTRGNKIRPGPELKQLQSLELRPVGVGSDFHHFRGTELPKDLQFREL